MKSLRNLPERLGELKNLRTLNLNYSLNKGAYVYKEGLTDSLRPLPSVLSDLVQLEELRLKAYGVISSNELRPLVQLKSLDLEYSGIETCKDIAQMLLLEDLNLNACRRIRDFSPLRSLKRLSRLNMSHTFPDSISFLVELNNLKNLDITEAICSDLDSIVNLQNIEELKADSKIEKKWMAQQSKTK